MKSKGFGLIITVVFVSLLILIFSGFYIVKSKKIISKNETNKTQNMTEITKNSNEDALKEEDKSVTDEVTSGEGITDIENDIKGTVILEEDFSNL